MPLLKLDTAIRRFRKGKLGFLLNYAIFDVRIIRSFSDIINKVREISELALRSKETEGRSIWKNIRSDPDLSLEGL